MNSVHCDEFDSMLVHFNQVSLLNECLVKYSKFMLSKEQMFLVFLLEGSQTLFTCCEQSLGLSPPRRRLGFFLQK